MSFMDLVVAINQTVSLNWFTIALTVDGSELFVVGWRSELGLTVVDISVNSHALKGSNYGLGEETDEKSGGDQ